MDIQAMNSLMTDHLFYLVAGMFALILILLIIMGTLWFRLSSLRKRYQRALTGTDGINLERMLIDYIDETKKVSEENRHIEEEQQRMDALLQRSITRMGVVRFSAFDGMGSDLSYAVALLDSHDNGVVLSSIFGRDESRCYAKPVEGGTSNYTLTQEEKEALKDAMRKG